MPLTISKAIELLTQDIANPGSVDILDVNEAERLALEALKRVKESRKKVYFLARSLLQGETKE